MFNLNKKPETNTSAIKENFATLVDTTKDNLSEVAKEATQSASRLGSKVQEKSKETTQDALELIDSLKALLAKNTDATYTDQIKDKVSEWKGLIQHEVANAVETSKAQTTKALREQPFMSLAVAIGAGIVIGYVLGNSFSNNQSSK